MDSLQAIKNRITSIRSTRQITQSMRLVATSKVQRVRTRMQENRPFLRESERLMYMVTGTLTDSNNRYMRKGKNGVTAVIVISSDRGLCGGYNINVNKEAARLLHTLNDVKLVTIGSKSREYFRRRKRTPESSYSGISETPFWEDAADIATLVLGWYDSGEVDAIYVVHTEFESMLKHNLCSRQVLPVERPAEMRDGPRALVRCEPAGEGMLGRAAGFFLTAYLFGAILEAACCEQSARIASMDSAVKNADEMVEMLTLRYNQARQSAITQELTEIIGGANAV